MKPYLIKFGIQLLSIFLMALLGGTMALILAGAAGGIGIYFAPQFHFHIVQGFFCPPDVSQQQSVAVSKLAMSEAALPLKAAVDGCILPDGTVKPEFASQATRAVVGFYFMLFFLPFFIPGSHIMWRFLNKFYNEITSPTDD